MSCVMCDSMVMGDGTIAHTACVISAKAPLLLNHSDSWPQTVKQVKCYTEQEWEKKTLKTLLNILTILQ